MLNDSFNSLQRDGALQTSLTVSVNSDISGEAGAWQRFQKKRGRGCHDQLFPADFQLKNLTAYEHLGQQMHWLILATRLVQELYAIWNSAFI